VFIRVKRVVWTPAPGFRHAGARFHRRGDESIFDRLLMKSCIERVRAIAGRLIPK